MFENRKARNALDGLTPELDKLDKDLQAAEAVRDPVERLVSFFNAVSAFADTKAPAVAETLATVQKGSKFTEAAEALKNLQTHIGQSGREEFGWNRTKKGETVTGDNVYLGNIYGRFTLTANRWKEAFNRDGATATEDRTIIEGQAAGFVKSHAEPMHKLIAKLKAPSA